MIDLINSMILDYKEKIDKFLKYNEWKESEVLETI